jgi:hypothetical protein
MNHVSVVINGESWGMYLNAQQFNRDFTRENFGSAEGARWKVPGSPGGRAGLDIPVNPQGLQAPVRDQEQGHAKGMGGSDWAHQGAEPDAA